MKIADMTEMQEIQAGMQILGKYVKKQGDGSVAAEHDIIYAGPSVSPKKMTKQHRRQLDKLGWFWDKSLPSWCHFV